MVHISWAGRRFFESRTQGGTSKFSQLILPVSLLIIACFLAILQPVSAASTTCYDPSGDKRPDIPCYPNAVDSFCCAPGWVCTNVSFCIAGPDVVLNPGDPEQFEGSCTDITWNSEACPSFCRNGNLSSNAANGLWDCSGGDWCCSAYTDDTTCCERDAGVFFLGDFVNITTIGGSIGPGFSTSTSPSSTSTSATVATTPASTTSSTPAASSPATSSPAASSSAPASESSNSGLDGGAKAGIAVGVVFGAILVVALLYLIWRNRKLVKSSRESAQMLAGYGNDPQKNSQFEMTSNFAPYHAQQRYEHGGIGSERAELPVEDPRTR